ncbi:MAG: biosynthetic arginine decarboxylase [Kiritimatiellia bacterium]
MLRKPLETWTVEDARELYGIRNWSGGYFDINEKGEVCVILPTSNGRRSQFSLLEIVKGLKARGINLPVLLRFGDILDSRIQLLNESFAKAIHEAGYRGEYRGVYPIKVNQQQQVVEEITRFGVTFHHGLEAGSKAELTAALAYLHDPEAFLICNGYKDEEFINLALHALKMGIQTIIVLEMPGELPLVLECAARIGVRPRIGIRARLTAKGAGRWSDSTGERSVFGLNPAQIMDVVDELRRRDYLDCLHMLHCHLGSQIPSIRVIRSGVSQAMRMYTELVREGAPMGLIDVGGGLAVDYDGSHTNFASSSNYHLDEYCADIVEVVMSIADEAGVPHPSIITESGRAIVAYYSVLLFNIMDVCRVETHPVPERLPDGTHEHVRNLADIAQSITSKNLQECYNDAVYYRDEIRDLFTHGNISLRELAMAEQIFWHIVVKIAVELREVKHVPQELQGLENALADVYYANFSVFQSLPDSWAIDQLFPIMPIHRLLEPPTCTAILADCTCDSDGKIDRFIDPHDVKSALPVHEVRPNEDYILGSFLVGAYQETLGDLHNLFGDTNVVSLRVDGENHLVFSSEIHGDSVADVLSYVEYDPKTMVDRFRSLAEAAVQSGRITAEERRMIMDAYQNSLRGYTYFES